ncbi:MAG: M24 family metallopeptidase [Pseudomonadota bacterium]
MTPETPSIPETEFAHRRARAAQAAGEAGLDALLVCSRGGGTLDRFGDVAYLTNFYTSFPYIPDLHGAWNDRAHAFVVVTADGVTRLVGDAPNDGSVALDGDAIRITDFVRDGLIDELCSLGLANGRIGLVGTDTLPAAALRGLETALPAAEFPDAGAILKDLRAVKSPAEIECLREASALGSKVMDRMMAAARPGASHGDVVAEGMQVLVPAGGLLYNSFMASGRGGEDPVYVRRNFPTWGAGERLEDGHWFRIGISGFLDRYGFDLSRSKAVGAATNREIQLLEDAIAIVEAAIAAIRPGVPAEDVARAGLERQTALGYPNDGVFSGLGHGIGLGWDAPWLAPGDRTPLRAGMVLCIERTIRKDGYLGDFEETVLVTETGGERLTSAQIRHW